MHPENILTSSVLDIIFEGRNKEYGAYHLRKTYSTRMLIAMGSVLALALMFSGLMRLKSGPEKAGESVIIIADTITLIDIPDEPEPLLKPKPAGTNYQTIDHTTPVISTETSDTIPTVEELSADVQIADFTQDGDPADVLPPPNPDESRTPAVEVEESSPPEPEIFEKSEIMPQFPGGLPALYRFLSRHLRVPEEEMQPGQRVRQVVRFVVGADGSISAITYPGSAGASFEKEVNRVLKKMPKWIPGSQNNRQVAVYFTIPVIFEVPEE